MLKDLGKRVVSSVGTRGLLVFAAVMVVLLPLDLVALGRLTGWEWGAALAGLIVLNLIPLAGQLVYFGLAVLGAFYLGQDNYTARIAAGAAPPPMVASRASPPSAVVPTTKAPAPAAAPVVSAPAPQAAPPQPTTNVALLPADKFAEWKRTVAAPTIQDDCLDDVKRRGLTEGKQIEMMAKACACYGAAANKVVTQADIADNAVRPSPDLNARLTMEAKRICSPTAN